jgi:hypothetical protein
MTKPTVLLAVGLALTGAGGALGTTAVSEATGQAAKTVTINVGQPGPPGPQGVPGSAGPRGAIGPTGPAGMACPAGYEPGRLVFNTPGGHEAIWACIE